MSAPVIDTAVIMAGGLGMRLRPYTTVLPKPLMPIGNMPILELLLRQLKAAGIRTVILSVNHLAHLIQAVIGDGHALGLTVTYQTEDRPLGTCGALALMMDRLPERFLVVNGDLLTDYPIARMMDAHISSEADATVATARKSVGVDFGVIVRDTQGRVSDYLEKPANVHEISIGLYALTRSAVADRITAGQVTDMPGVLVSLLADGRPVQAHTADCTWIDIGRPEQYQQAQEMFEANAAVFLPPAV